MSVEEWQKQVASDNEILNFVVSWAPITNYLQKFPDETKMDSLSELSARNLKKVLLCIKNVIQVLPTGKIQIITLHLLLRRQDQFCKVVTAAGHDHDRVKTLIKVRELELKAFQTAILHLNRLCEHIHKFLQADEAHIVKATVEKFQNQDLPLSDVCEIASLDSIQDLEHYQPTANPWRFDDAILLILSDVDKKMASLLFRKMFSELDGHVFNDTSLDFWRRFLMLWDRANKEWNAIHTKLADGSATIDEVEKLFNLFEAEGTYKYATIEAELKKVAGGESVDWVKEIFVQFQCHADIKKHVKAAEALLQAKDVYNFQGNFADIVKICQLNQNASKLIRDLDKSVLGFCEKLKHIESKDISCLREFSTPQCKKLVEWIRKTMEGGIKELKVFVDLALISAGEEPMSLDKVNCFHAATIGYAPLIFTEIQDLSHLLEQCKIVFKNVTADPQLPQNLRDWKNILGKIQRDCKNILGKIQNESETFKLILKPECKSILGNIENESETFKLILKPECKSILGKIEAKSRMPSLVLHAEFLKVFVFSLESLCVYSKELHHPTSGPQAFQETALVTSAEILLPEIIDIQGTLLEIADNLDKIDENVQMVTYIGDMAKTTGAVVGITSGLFLYFPTGVSTFFRHTGAATYFGGTMTKITAWVIGNFMNYAEYQRASKLYEHFSEKMQKVEVRLGPLPQMKLGMKKALLEIVHEVFLTLYIMHDPKSTDRNSALNNLPFGLFNTLNVVDIILQSYNDGTYRQQLRDFAKNDLGSLIDQLKKHSS